MFFKYAQKEITRIKRKVKEGINIRDLLGSKKEDLFGYRRQAKNELLNNLAATRGFAEAQVKDELERQKP